jgi:hypothetical protein
MHLPAFPPPVSEPDLFGPPLSLPHWEMFPALQRQTALRLLTQLLREHPLLPSRPPAEHAAATAARAGTGVADE